MHLQSLRNETIYARPVLMVLSLRSNPINRCHKSSRAFTLTEMLVSTAVLSLLVLLMFNIVEGASRGWRTTEQRVDAFREARAALFVIARDLSAIVNLNARDAALPAFVHNNGHPHGNESIADLPDDSTAPADHGDNIFFIAAQPADAQPADNRSDLCAIGYFLAYTTSGANAAGSYRLYRHFLGSDDTFQRISAKILGNTQPLFQASLTGQNAADMLARNVIDFFIVPYRADGTTPLPGAAWPSNEMPAFVEISITAFNAATAARFSREDWKDRTSQIFNENRQTFTTRVRISSP